MRVGLGNLATTRCGETRADSLAGSMHRPAVSAHHGATDPKKWPRKSKEQLGGEVLRHAPYGGTLTDTSATSAPKAKRVDRAPGTRDVGSETLGAQQTGGSLAIAGEKQALRHFLHAIHACPTASAAWLNASEVYRAQNARSSRRMIWGGGPAIMGTTQVPQAFQQRIEASMIYY